MWFLQCDREVAEYAGGDEFTGGLVSQVGPCVATKEFVDYWRATSCYTAFLSLDYEESWGGKPYRASLWRG